MNQDYSNFINTDDLSRFLGDPHLVIVDCRFDLKNPDWGYQVFQAGHIPGAVYAHLDHDLSSEVTMSTGRHPLPSNVQFNETVIRLGIRETSQVVAYDDQGGAYAARLWWLLRYYGHQKAALLNGGYTKWVRENRPINTGSPAKILAAPAPFLSINPSLVVTTSDVFENLSSGKFLLVDARSNPRYRGEVEPIDTAAGHIPGAKNHFHGENLNPDMTTKSKEELLVEFRELLGDYSPDEVVVYCGSGVTSCLNIAAMEYAGLPGARLYPGSWSEWIRDTSRPIAVEPISKSQ